MKTRTLVPAFLRVQWGTTQKSRPANSMAMLALSFSQLRGRDKWSSACRAGDPLVTQPRRYVASMVVVNPATVPNPSWQQRSH
eukprot:362384-Chlamydomonas_euryale.AAC.7